MYRLKHLVFMNTEHEWKRGHLVAAFLFHTGWWTSSLHSLLSSHNVVSIYRQVFNLFFLSFSIYLNHLAQG